tara:strand:+ start:125 stop:229 length:105 start_codon:yes stop_codon:yes gene_type:complete
VVLVVELQVECQVVELQEQEIHLLLVLLKDNLEE